MGCTIRLTGDVRQMYILCMHLAEYMDANGLRDEDVAELLGVSRGTVSRIRRRKIRPGWHTIEKIRTATAGAVTADDFVGPLACRNGETAACP
jgi:transcriptional regulator with XRE-family HTH domain